MATRGDLLAPRGSNNLLSPQEMAQYEGELAWPVRFDRAFDIATEYEVGSIAYPGQYQQSPVPRKGGIIKREYWMDYLPTREGKFPDMDFVCVSVDTAFTEKEENDPTGCTTWGVWTDPEDGFPKVMLLAAWRKHLPIHGVEQEPRGRTEEQDDYLGASSHTGASSSTWRGVPIGSAAPMWC
jgi:hypothetical protein